MARTFQVPEFYRSPVVSKVKARRMAADPKKKDLSPSIIDYGVVRFKLARHFGFCFGVENAIEIAYRAIDENPGKRIFLLSEMIHNQSVNNDLKSRGVKFLMETSGEPIIPLKSLSPEDIVIVPAFGTTLELQSRLEELGIDPYYYDTTCPFVEKVWRRSAELGKKGFAVVVHGKRTHEETRATFSHSKATAPTLVVLDMEEAKLVCRYIEGDLPEEDLRSALSEGMSKDFEPSTHLKKIGVVNQTTMLASETSAISKALRDSLVRRFGEENIKSHFADTRDTLCYATYENQTATMNLIESGADIALVVGGYNSSNTSHLVELCEEAMSTFYIKEAGEIISSEKIRHFDLHSSTVKESKSWLPKKDGVIDIALTSGASCPDIAIENVLRTLLKFYPEAASEPQFI